MLVFGIISLLFGPKCCIWNRLCWNSNVICRS